LRRIDTGLAAVETRRAKLTASTLTRSFVTIVGAALFSITCIVGAVAPADARSTPDSSSVTVSTRVSYAGLDLTDLSTRTALERRIKAAAYLVCASAGRELGLRTIDMRCVKAAIANAHSS
jgi:UrcA family protein